MRISPGVNRLLEVGKESELERRARISTWSCGAIGITFRTASIVREAGGSSEVHPAGEDGGWSPTRTPGGAAQIPATGGEGETRTTSRTR